MKKNLEYDILVEDSPCHIMVEILGDTNQMWIYPSEGRAYRIGETAPWVKAYRPVHFPTR